MIKFTITLKEKLTRKEYRKLSVEFENETGTNVDFFDEDGLYGYAAEIDTDVLETLFISFFERRNIVIENIFFE